LRGEGYGESVVSFPLFDKERDSRVSSCKFPLFLEEGVRGSLSLNYLPSSFHDIKVYGRIRVRVAIRHSGENRNPERARRPRPYLFFFYVLLKVFFTFNYLLLTFGE
jgi:hypothetical protein